MMQATIKSTRGFYFGLPAWAQKIIKARSSPHLTDLVRSILIVFGIDFWNQFQCRSVVDMPYGTHRNNNDRRKPWPTLQKHEGLLGWGLVLCLDPINWPLNGVTMASYNTSDMENSKRGIANERKSIKLGGHLYCGGWRQLMVKLVMPFAYYP